MPRASAHRIRPLLQSCNTASCTCRPSGRGMTASERFGSRCRRLTLERTKVLNNHGPIESLACAMPWNPRHLSSRCSVARYSRKFSQGNYDGSFERNRGSHRFQRVFEKSPFCHISPTMFPHSSFQTAGANPGPRTVSLDLPGLFKHPLRGPCTKRKVLR